MTLLCLIIIFIHRLGLNYIILDFQKIKFDLDDTKHNMFLLHQEFLIISLIFIFCFTYLLFSFLIYLLNISYLLVINNLDQQHILKEQLLHFLQQLVQLHISHINNLFLFFHIIILLKNQLIHSFYNQVFLFFICHLKFLLLIYLHLYGQVRRLFYHLLFFYLILLKLYKHASTNMRKIIYPIAI